MAEGAMTDAGHGIATIARWRATVTLLVVALSLGASWSHILQIRGKAVWDGRFWRAAMESLYRDYAIIGGPVELAAIALACWLAFSLRRDRAARGWAFAGAGLLALAFFGLWIGFIAPINAEFATWTPETVPAGWTAWRDRWEFWHAVIAGVKACAFAALVLALLPPRAKALSP
jgi:hypothetical protein